MKDNLSRRATEKGEEEEEEEEEGRGRMRGERQEGQRV
jgi:hypothetical protein